MKNKLYKILATRLSILTILIMSVTAMSAPPPAAALCSCTHLIVTCLATCNANPNGQDCQNCTNAVDICECTCNPTGC